MTVEEMIAERTVKVTAALDEANDTISLKGGTPSADLHGLAAAIDSIPTISVISLTATENGTYTAPDGTAYSPVTVDVQGGGIGYTEYTASGLATATIADIQQYWDAPASGENSWQIIQIVPLQAGFTAFYNASTLIRLHYTYSGLAVDKVITVIRSTTNIGSASFNAVDSTSRIDIPNGFKLLVYDKVVIS